MGDTNRVRGFVVHVVVISREIWDVWEPMIVSSFVCSDILIWFNDKIFSNP